MTAAGEALPDGAELRRHREGAAPEVIAVVRGPFVIGRSGGDLNLDDQAVSRRHCELVRKDEQWIVRDLGSSNGTFVNGERAAERTLKDGDRLRVGQTELVFARRRGEPGAGDAGGVHSGLAEDTAIWSLMELSVSLSERKIWEHAYLETTIKRCKAERGCLVAVDPVTGVVSPVAAVAMEFVEAGPEGVVPFSRSIVEQCLKERRVVSSAGADVDPRFREATSVAQYEIRAVACAPARWRGSPIGAVYVERVVGGTAFEPETVQTLQDLADLFGLATMAWRGYHTGARDEWERERLARTFDEGAVKTLAERGGAAAIRRRVQEVCVAALHLSRLDGILASVSDDVFRLVSQLYGQANEIFLRHGGALLSGGCAQFAPLDDRGPDGCPNAVKAALDIQRASRPLVKRLAREFKAGLAVGIGVSGGLALTGYFGAGERVDYMGIGEVLPVALGLAFQANDGEVLIDQATFSRVRVHYNTHRLAPVALPGIERQVQVFRVVA